MARLSKRQRIACRARAAEAALLGFRQRGMIGYTQGSARWSGISGRRDASKGQYPPLADCSAFTTWALWNGLYLGFGEPDCVNGAAWRYGYTGSQVSHGRRVTGEKARGDLVFYAGSGQTPTHVAIVVGRVNGRHMVVSHGQSSGPLYLPWDYRRVVQVRRYIHDGV